MAELEEQLVHERSRGGSLESKLERERDRREIVQGELDKAKQVGIDVVWSAWCAAVREFWEGHGARNERGVARKK